MQQSPPYRTSPWPHRLTAALALVTFPLIWVGGLVTTYDAGMAVPDWPGTYGYNLFRYPWQTWLAGPWDLFIEHGHRLLGATAGVLAIALVAVVWATDQRRWLLWAAIGALALVILQGVLGGIRVLFDERQMALVHGCVGPLFFAYLAFLSIATSRWFVRVSESESANGRRFARLSWTVLAAAYTQLALGAILRHVPLASGAGLFRAALWMHLLLAATLLVLAMLSVVRSLALKPAGYRPIILASMLLLLVGIQIALGAWTYVAKYAYPTWLLDYAFAASYVVQEKSLAQSLVVTTHVATGSLILFVAALQVTAATRVFFPLAAGLMSSARLLPLAPQSGRTAA